MKTSITLFLFLFITSSCSVFSSLNSNTSIKPNDSFYLGKNEHGKFKVTLKNISNHEIEIYFTPINGGSYSRKIIKINEIITTRVAKNTAIVIENKSNDYASIDLKVTGDLNLGMQYQK